MSRRRLVTFQRARTEIPELPCYASPGQVFDDGQWRVQVLTGDRQCGVSSTAPANGFLYPGRVVTSCTGGFWVEDQSGVLHLQGLHGISNRCTACYPPARRAS